MTTLRQALNKTHQNLQILQEREAKFGGNAPLELVNQISDHQAAISLLEEALESKLTEKGLDELKDALAPLLVVPSNLDAADLAELKLEVPPLPFEPEMILIPAGSFTMGSEPGPKALPEETPQHDLELPAYHIGKYPITNEQYAAFIEAVAKQELPRHADWSGQRKAPAGRLDHPVTGVSWYDALAYCAWLSDETGQSRIYRLPTEAEWEKAARGTDGRLFPWGNKWQAKHCNAESETTTPVTAHPDGAGPFGCEDMVGNVQEWVSTAWGSRPQQNDFSYPYRPDDGRENHADQRAFTFRIHRGRSYRDERDLLRCTARGYASPDSRVGWRGFRVVRDES